MSKFSKMSFSFITGGGGLVDILFLCCSKVTT